MSNNTTLVPDIATPPPLPDYLFLMVMTVLSVIFIVGFVWSMTNSVRGRHR